MKKILLLLLIALCWIGWHSEAILQKFGTVNAVSAPPSSSTQSLSVQANKKQPPGMSLKEYAELAKTDPDAYRRLLQSNQQEQERSEVDKLMNFFAHLKYE